MNKKRMIGPNLREALLRLNAVVETKRVLARVGVPVQVPQDHLPFMLGVLRNADFSTGAHEVTIHVYKRRDQNGAIQLRAVDPDTRLGDHR